jgi:hypothetical protein
MKLFRKQFLVLWKNLKKRAIDESKRFYSQEDFDEDTFLFI